MADTWDVEDTTAQQASEQFGDMEFVAEVKNKLGPNMSGYYSSLLDKPSEFMHVLELNKNAHPDDLYSLNKLFGGFYSKPTNPTVTLDSVIKQQLGLDWYSKKQNPHIGSPIHAFKPGQTAKPGNLYMNPKALTGAWDEKQPSKVGHPMDIWGHELGHSARYGQNLLGQTGLLNKAVPDELVQSYEDALYGLSSINKSRAIDAIMQAAFNPATTQGALLAPLQWGNTMKALTGSNAWATPYGKFPSYDLINY